MKNLLILFIYLSLSPLAHADLEKDVAEIKQLERELQERKAVVRTHKKLLRAKALQLRGLELEKKRSLRLKHKCEKVTQQINRLNQRLRTGYTIQQGLSIERKLAECQEEKRKYCTNE